MSIIPYRSFAIFCVKEQSARSVHFSRGLASRSRSSVESVRISAFSTAESCRALVPIQRRLNKKALMFMNHHPSSSTVQSSSNLHPSSISIMTFHDQGLLPGSKTTPGYCAGGRVAANLDITYSTDNLQKVTVNLVTRGFKVSPHSMSTVQP